MSILLAFVSLILLSPLQLGAGTDDCTPTRCTKQGPLIHFPFRNKYLQPEHCGYPGFDVHCDHKNETVLMLPFSVNVTICKIDYVSQTLETYDPEDCLFPKLQSLNLSASPFYFSDHYLYDFTLFNCSGPSGAERDGEFTPVCSRSDSNNTFYAVQSYHVLEDDSMTSCTNIHNFESISYDVFLAGSLVLNWSEPACGLCEAQGRRCNFKNYTQCNDKSKINQGASKAPLVAGATLGSILFVIVLAALLLLYNSIKSKKEHQRRIEKFLGDYKALKPTRFSYLDVIRITNQFSEKLGEGGYGIVYKGKLSNEINVAVKVLNNFKGNGEEFVNEVGTIGRIHHVNVVRLVGFCAEGYKRALIYEFLPNDSLEKFIFSTISKKNSLGWQKLQDIALGIAKGIEYLHQGCDQQILHFDIKPHNILLDHNFNPKICDFGLAKLCSKEKSAVTMTVARGTLGYIAPEVLSRTFGRVSNKSDVYSFGMLLLEMVGGRKNVDPQLNTSQVYFPQWIYNHLSLDEDFWAHVEEVEDGNIARKLAIVGLWCIQWCPTNRPSIKSVVQMLEGDVNNLTTPPNPFQAANVTNSIAAIPETHHQMELPIILELE